MVDEGDMHKMNTLSLSCLVAALAFASCAKQKQANETANQKSELLPDVSGLTIGQGYDRALSRARNSCFAREAAATTSLQQWSATGFTAFNADEVPTRIRTAIGVGPQVAVQEGNLGIETAAEVGPSSETPYVVMLSRFDARAEQAGPIRGAGSACRHVPNDTANGLADFVTTCGDVSLERRIFGGHVLLSWRRDSRRPAVDALVSSLFGATTVGATLDPVASLQALLSQGFDSEMLVVETSGMPSQPSTVVLPSGGRGMTVHAALEYFKRLTFSAVTSFPQVVDYTTRRYDMRHVDLCLAETGRASTVGEDEWACVHNHLTDLVESRDGVGNAYEQWQRYVAHKHAYEHYRTEGRLVFATVPQSRCAGDFDGDSNFETSGPCQEELLLSFVKFYEACSEGSTRRLSDCRNDVLGTVNTCADFEAKDCRLPEYSLSNGHTVTCDESGVNAALADVVGYQVRPPFTPQTPPPGSPPQVTVFELNSMGRGTVDLDTGFSTRHTFAESLALPAACTKQTSTSLHHRQGNG